MSVDKDFVIKDGVLKKYVGNGGDIDIPEGVVEIAGSAFFECENIVSVKMPKSITKIGSWAYCGCSSLARVTLPQGITKISNCSFKGCGSLTTFLVPESVTKIGEAAFCDCVSLSDITLPNSLTAIGASTFTRCKALKNILLPENVKEIGAWAFEACEGLSNITILGRLKKIGRDVFEKCPQLYSLCAPKLPLDMIKEHGLILSASIGFLLNSELYEDDKIADEYIKYISAQKKRILPLLFENDSIKGVKLYAELGKISPKNFEEDFLTPALSANATQCVAFLMEWKNQNISQDETDKQLLRELTKDPFNAADMKKLWLYEKQEDGTIKITGYKGDEKEIEIPERIGSSIVTSIGKEAFSCHRAKLAAKRKDVLKNITSIAIPETVANIGEEAFRGCEGLQDENGLVIVRDVLYDYFGTESNVTIPDGIKRIAANSFCYKMSISSLEISKSVTEIGDHAFEGCVKLQSVILPDGLKSIGEYAFSFSYLTAVNIPGQVTEISGRAFDSCVNLTSIELTQNVTEIGDYAFSGCRKLQSVILPDGLKSIGKYAFSFSGLTAVNIPGQVTEICGGAFSYCSGLTSVKLTQNIAEISRDAFQECNNLTIHAPAGSYAEKYAKENNIPFVAE